MVMTHAAKGLSYVACVTFKIIMMTATTKKSGGLKRDRRWWPDVVDAKRVIVGDERQARNRKGRCVLGH